MLFSFLFFSLVGANYVLIPKNILEINSINAFSNELGLKSA
jgi:hypothetical protein